MVHSRLAVCAIYTCPVLETLRLSGYPERIGCNFLRLVLSFAAQLNQVVVRRQQVRGDEKRKASALRLGSRGLEFLRPDFLPVKIEQFFAHDTVRGVGDMERDLNQFSARGNEEALHFPGASGEARVE